MHLFAYLLLLVALLGAIFFGAGACFLLWTGNDKAAPMIRSGHHLMSLLLLMASAVLLWALWARDFSFEYVQDYTNSVMPLFYALTAFWAGQAGSLLFWAVFAALFGSLFALTPAYKSLTPSTRLWFWVFHMSVMAVFLLLVSCWSNPFVRLDPPPMDGRGMNPLLMNPGMIFHPPLLFLGYAGFTVPACLALAQTISGNRDLEPTWLAATRNFSLGAWLLLTGGIILGGWWSYMELGWGGYWAWDPVENASLIPWLTASAFLHTAVLERRRGSLVKTNVFLVSLTLISCFFGTYLVRSGVVDSLHAFAGTGVGPSLLVYILFSLALTVVVLLAGKRMVGRPLSGLMSREGFLIMTAWLLLLIGVVILLGTMWPVISNAFGGVTEGLNADFYNKVCLPFFVIVALMLTICPWLGWKGGLRARWPFLAVLAVLAGAFALVWFVLGVPQHITMYKGVPVGPLGAGAAIACVAGILLVFVTDRGVRKVRSSWGAYGVHLGLALVVLGVAFSGPYQTTDEAILNPGETMQVGEYTMTYVEMTENSNEAMGYVEAYVTVDKDGEPYGELRPQRRIYRNFETQIFSEVSVIPSLGDELYATLLATAQDQSIRLQVKVNPLVNWMWIGGTLMFLFPLLGFARVKRGTAGATPAKGKRS